MAGILRVEFTAAQDIQVSDVTIAIDRSPGRTFIAAPNNAPLPLGFQDGSISIPEPNAALLLLILGLGRRWCRRPQKNHIH